MAGPAPGDGWGVGIAGDASFDDGPASAVVRAWLLLGCVGLGLLVLSVAVAGRLARSVVRPLAAVARGSPAPTPPSEAIPAVAPPGSAWTLHAGSRNPPGER